MRLLFVVHQFLPELSAGTEQVALRLASAARRSGHRAIVLTCSLDPDADWRGTTPEGFRATAVQGIPVIGIPIDMLPDVWGFGPPPDQPPAPNLDAALDALLARERIDVAHLVHAMRTLVVAEFLTRRGVPIVLTLTDFFLICHRVNLVRKDGALCDGPDGGHACAAHCPEPDTDALARYARVSAVLAHADFVVAGSEFVAAAFRREHPDLAVRVIPHGIDLLRAKSRTRGEGSAVFGYIGTVSRPKGVDMLVAAFAAAEAPDARLEVYGPLSIEPDGLATLDRHAADPRIRLHGPVPAERVPEVMAELDVLCLPSRLPETFSLALHEGFAAGLPPLVSDLGHPARVVRDAACGRVLPAGDQAAWTSAIEDVAVAPTQLAEWRERLPLPWRLEEEAFLYSQLYRACVG